MMKSDGIVLKRWEPSSYEFVYIYLSRNYFSDIAVLRPVMMSGQIGKVAIAWRSTSFLRISPRALTLSIFDNNVIQ